VPPSRQVVPDVDDPWRDAATRRTAGLKKPPPPVLKRAFAAAAAAADVEASLRRAAPLRRAAAAARKRSDSDEYPENDARENRRGRSELAQPVFNNFHFL